MKFKIGEAFLASIAASWLVFIFGPLHLLFTNENVWSEGAAFVFTRGLVPAAISALILVSLCGYRYTRKLSLPLFSGFALFYFFMVVFFPHQAGLLDGNQRSEPLWVIAAAGSLFLMACALAVFFPVLVKKCILFVAACAACFSLYAYLVIKPVDTLVPESASGRTLASFDEAGSNENVFVFMVDMLQGAILEKAMKADASVAGRYDGFIFFTRAMSSFPATGFSLPNIMSGKFYNEEKKTFAEVNAAARRDSFIEDARSRGYKVSALAYSKTMPLSSRSDENISSEMYLGVDDGRRTTLVYGHFLIASLVRNTKIPERYVAETASLFLGGVPIVELGTLTQQKLRSRDALLKWASRLSVGPEKKIFFQHHIMAHAPVLFARDGRILENIPSSLDSVSGEYLYTMESVAASLDRMRALGIYDKSLIIITGDHGHYLSAGLHEELPFDASYKGKNWQAAGMYNPAVLVKPPFSHGDLTYLESVFHLSDVRAVVSCYLQSPRACDRQSIMRIANDGPRTGTVFLSDRSTVRNYWFSDQHEPLSIDGNVTALPSALKTWDPTSRRQ